MSFLFKKPKQSQQQQPTPLPEDPNQQQQDLEEDGFLLVGQTEDERNALTPEKRNSNHDMPPMYQFAEEGQDYNPSQAQQSPPPFYENFHSHPQPNAHHQTNPEYENLNKSRSSSSPASAQGQSQMAKTPLHDIPFKIDDSVVCAFNYGQLNIDIGDELLWTTSQYHYDFTMERSIVQQSNNF